jgi:hypothetical protein
MSAIHDRIRKLLALANDKGASEAEAETAMSMASALMLRHGIEQRDVGPKPTVAEGKRLEADRRYHEYVANAASVMCGTRFVTWNKADVIAFVGRLDNIAASEDLFAFLCDQVERLYKLNLPRGLSKAARAEFRQTFKEACAMRIWQRAHWIIDDLKKNEQSAQKATGSTALVVANHYDTLQSEIKGYFESRENITMRQKPLRTRHGNGTIAGQRAGDTVDLNKKIS